MLNFAAFVCFDLAYWMFAIKYWATSINMQKTRYGVNNENSNKTI